MRRETPLHPPLETVQRYVRAGLRAAGLETTWTTRIDPVESDDDEAPWTSAVRIGALYADEPTRFESVLALYETVYEDARPGITGTVRVRTHGYELWETTVHPATRHHPEEMDEVFVPGERHSTAAGAAIAAVLKLVRDRVAGTITSIAQAEEHAEERERHRLSRETPKGEGEG